MLDTKRLEVCVPALRRYALSLTRDPEIASDLVQDTCVRALRSADLFYGGDARTWLYTILTNLNRNRLRSLVRQPQLVEPIGLDEPHCENDPERIVVRSRLKAALDTLSPEQREVLDLVVFEDKSYQDVAELLGIPKGTVMSRLARARAYLREKLL